MPAQCGGSASASFASDLWNSSGPVVLGVSKRLGNEREARRADLLNVGCDAFLPVPPSWAISAEGHSHSLHGSGPDNPCWS